MTYADVTFVSVWPSLDVETEATLDMKTGIVSDIECSNVDVNDDFCEGEFIEFKDERFPIKWDDEDNDICHLANPSDLTRIQELARY